MRTVFLASLRTHMRRYVAATIAVTVSVAFIVVIGVLTSGARAGLMESWGAAFRGADYVVDADPVDKPLDTSVAIDVVERLGENASGLGRIMVPARSSDWRGETTVGPVAAHKELRWQKLVSGRFPEGTGEAVVHVWDAQAREIAIGDRIGIGEGATTTDVEVVGLVESPSVMTQASVYVTWRQYLRWRDHSSFHVGRVAVRGEVGQLPEGTTVTPAEQYVTDSVAKNSNDTDTFALMALLFAAIALVISALVIANTFAILFAQRLRDFALLRCVGATRRQVLGSVRREAATLGVLASLTGTLAGAGLGYGVIALINARTPKTTMGAPQTPMAAPELPTTWLLGGFAVGLVVTMVAAWLPTRRAVRVSPLAALRPEAAVGAHTAAGRARLVLAALLLVTGLALLGMAMIRGNTALMVAGGGSVSIGVLLFGPVLVPRLVRITGALFGPAGRLATKNAVRNPRRTAATTASLLVGFTVTTAVLTGMSTASAAMDEQRDKQHPIDAALTSLDKPLTTDLVDQVRRTPGVEQAIALNGAKAHVAGLKDPIPVLTAPDAAQVARDGGKFAQVEPGTIRLDQEAFQSLSIQPGDRVTVRVGDRQAQLRATFLSGWGQTGVVAPETLEKLTDTPEPHAIWVRTARDADPMRLVDDLDDLADAAGAESNSQLQARAVEDRQLQILTWSVLGLLGISVTIAVIGIANTLGLSVLERAREHAMLRALGLTRRQLRRMLAAEAMLLSVVATLLGTVIGVGFAWVAYETVVKRVLSHATLHIPWLELGAVVLTAALAGLLASVLPARRAARVTPAAGLSLD